MDRSGREEVHDGSVDGLRQSLLPDDPDGLELRAADVDPADVDPYPVEAWGQPPDTTWTLDLHDPYLWADAPS